MYCQYCEEEQAPRARFCKACGSTLVRRDPEAIRADLGRIRYLLAELGRWQQAGRLAPSLAEDLAKPYRRREEAMVAALADVDGTAPAPLEAPTPEAALPVSAPVATGSPGPAAPAASAQAAGDGVPSAMPEAVAKAPADVEPILATVVAAPAQPLPPAAEVAASALPATAPEPAPVPGTEEGPHAAQVREDEALRDAAVGLAAAVAASGTAEHLDFPEPKLTPEQQVIERESPWSTVWRPFLYENIGWFVGAFLLLAGSFYFVAESQGVRRTLLVASLLSAYSTGFWWVGRHLAVRRSLTTAGRVLASIAGALSTMVILALEPLRHVGPLAWGAAALTGVLGTTALARACAGVFGERERTHFTAASGALLALFAAVPIFGSGAPLAAIDALGLLVLWFAVARIGSVRDDRGHAAFLAGGLGWLALVLFIRAHYQALASGAPFGPTHYGPLATLLVAVLLRGERKLRPMGGGPSWLAVLGYVALLPAVLASVGSRASLAIACGVSALLLAQAARVYRSRGFALVALAVGWISFHTSTGLFRREWIFALRDGVKFAAGYGATDPLPWNYGALASLIYLAALIPLYRRALRSEAGWAVKAIRDFSLGLTATVLAWAHLGGDLKPALFAAICVALLSHAASVWFAHDRLAYVTAAALVLVGLDGALALRLTPAAAELGLALGALAVAGAGRLLAEPRRRAFTELALPASLLSALLVATAGTGPLAGAAALAAALACLASAFALGSSLPAVPALVAAVVGATELADVLVRPNALPWIDVALAALLLGASGLERRARAPCEPSRWLGVALPLPARGFDVLREPLAWVGTALLGWCIPFAVAMEARQPALLTGALAVGFFFVARRFAAAAFLYVGALLATASAAIGLCEPAGWEHAGLVVGAAALALGAAAVGLRHSERAAGAIFRMAPASASLPFALCSSALVAPTAVYAALEGAGVGGEAGAAVGLAALSYLALAHWNRNPLWLYPASALGAAAVGLALHADALPLMFAAASLVHLALALLDARAPRAARLLLGAEAPSRHVAVLAHLHAASAVLAALMLTSVRGTAGSAFVLPAALLAVFYALAPRLDRAAGWLAVSGLAAWSAAALALPAEAGLLLAVFAVLLAGAGALCRAFPRASERALATDPGSAAATLAGTGLALAVLALSALAIDWNGCRSHGAALAGLVALAFALAPRTFATPLLLAPSAAAAWLACVLGLPQLSTATVSAGFALGLPALAVLLRRLPVAVRLAFGLEEETALLAARTLTATAIAAFALVLGLELAASVYVVRGTGLDWPLALGVVAAGSAVGFFASSWPAMLALSGSSSILAAGAGMNRVEHAFLAATAVLNALLALVGGLQTERGRSAAARVCDSFSAPALRRGLPAGAVTALLLTSVAWAGVGLLAIAFVALARWIVFALGLAPTLTLLMLAAQVLTAWHQLRRHRTLLSWHMALPLLPIALWLVGGPALWPWLAGGACVLLAGFEALLDREAGARVLERIGLASAPAERMQLANVVGGYATVVAVLAIAGTRLETRDLATSAALAFATIGFGVRARFGSRPSLAACLALVPPTIHFALFYVGHLLSTGRPAETILPSLAAAMALATLTAERLGCAGGERRRALLAASHVYAIIAALEWIAGVALVHFHSVELWASGVAILVLTLFYGLRARDTGSEALAYLANAAFLGGYLSLRLHTDWFGPAGRRSEADAVAGLVFGFLYVGVHGLVRRVGLEVFRRPAQVMAHLMPIAGALMLDREATLLNAVLLFAFAVQLTALAAVEGRGRVAGLLAALAYNLAIAVLWVRAGVGGLDKAQFYVIPAGLTLIALARIYRQAVGAEWQPRLRATGILIIYLSSVYPALSSFEHTSYFLWCAFLCVLGVAAGIALRVRAYLYLGTGFLVTCVVGNLIRYGVRDHQLGAAALTVMGLLIVGGMIYFNVQREALLRRYHKVQALLSSWE